MAIDVLCGIHGNIIQVNFSNKIGDNKLRKHKLGIYATCDGFIYTQGFSNTLGNRIYKRIDGTKKLERYCHLLVIFTEDGQFVKEGELIGIMGNSGNSTATHLHYDILKDETILDSSNHIDPTEHLKNCTPPTNTKVSAGYGADFSHIYGRPYKHRGFDFGGDLIEGWDCDFINEFRSNIKKR